MKQFIQRNRWSLLTILASFTISMCLLSMWLANSENPIVEHPYELLAQVQRGMTVNEAISLLGPSIQGYQIKTTTQHGGEYSQTTEWELHRRSISVNLPSYPTAHCHFWLGKFKVLYVEYDPQSTWTGEATDTIKKVWLLPIRNPNRATRH